MADKGGNTGPRASFAYLDVRGLPGANGKKAPKTGAGGFAYTAFRSGWHRGIDAENPSPAPFLSDMLTLTEHLLLRTRGVSATGTWRRWPRDSGGNVATVPLRGDGADPFAYVGCGPEGSALNVTNRAFGWGGGTGGLAQLYKDPGAVRFYDTASGAGLDRPRRLLMRFSEKRTSTNARTRIYVLRPGDQTPSTDIDDQVRDPGEWDVTVSLDELWRCSGLSDHGDQTLRRSIGERLGIMNTEGGAQFFGDLFNKTDPSGARLDTSSEIGQKGSEAGEGAWMHYGLHRRRHRWPGGLEGDTLQPFEPEGTWHGKPVAKEQLLYGIQPVAATWAQARRAIGKADRFVMVYPDLPFSLYMDCRETGVLLEVWGAGMTAVHGHAVHQTEWRAYESTDGGYTKHVGSKPDGAGEDGEYTLHEPEDGPPETGGSWNHTKSEIPVGPEDKAIMTDGCMPAGTNIGSRAYGGLYPMSYISAHGWWSSTRFADEKTEASRFSMQIQESGYDYDAGLSWFRAYDNPGSTHKDHQRDSTGDVFRFRGTVPEDGGDTITLLFRTAPGALGEATVSDVLTEEPWGRRFDNRDDGDDVDADPGGEDGEYELRSTKWLHRWKEGCGVVSDSDSWWTSESSLSDFSNDSEPWESTSNSFEPVTPHEDSVEPDSIGDRDEPWWESESGSAEWDTDESDSFSEESTVASEPWDMSESSGYEESGEPYTWPAAFMVDETRGRWAPAMKKSGTVVLVYNVSWEATFVTEDRNQSGQYTMTSIDMKTGSQSNDGIEFKDYELDKHTTRSGGCIYTQSVPWEWDDDLKCGKCTIPALNQATAEAIVSKTMPPSCLAAADMPEVKSPKPVMKPYYHWDEISRKTSKGGHYTVRLSVAYITGEVHKMPGD